MLDAVEQTRADRGPGGWEEKKNKNEGETAGRGEEVAAPGQGGIHASPFANPCLYRSMSRSVCVWCMCGEMRWHDTDVWMCLIM